MLNEKEIQEAADHASTIAQKQNEIDYEGIAPFEMGFEQGVQWALEQMKQKDTLQTQLEMFYDFLFNIGLEMEGL